MLLKDLKKEKIYNQHDMLNEGAPCYDENEILDIADVNYMNEQGEGVYSIWLGTRGEYEIEKIRNQWVVVTLKKHRKYKRALKIIALPREFYKKKTN